MNQLVRRRLWITLFALLSIIVLVIVVTVLVVHFLVHPQRESTALFIIAGSLFAVSATVLVIGGVLSLVSHRKASR